MSLKYNEYLYEHCSGVRKGLQWMADNLVSIDQTVLDKAMSNAEVHDNSKMQPEEYKAYDDYFYGGNKSAKVKEAFDYAWLHHIHNNPHHWQYWVLINDDASEGTKALEMPLEYVYEMIADWWSFSWKKGNLMEIFDWYNDHKSRIIFHKNTKKVVETILDNIKSILKMQLRKEQPAKFEDEDETVEQIKFGEDYYILDHSDLKKDKEKKFGVPEEHKFPLPDADHVRSAIRFFNYVDPKYEKELAEAILKRMDEYGLSFEDFGVGDENRFKKYIPEKYLAHHGIQGQEWGKRNGPPYPLNREDKGDLTKAYTEENLKNADKRNLDSWGKSADTNCLYISGSSGSGKSTVALGLADNGDTVIHLDGYTEPDIYDGMESIQNKKFNSYLDEHVANWKDIYMDKDKAKAQSKDYWKKVDEFRDAIESYSKEEFESGHKVIVEGVQITNGWLSEGQSEYKDKPFIFLIVDAEVARRRARERDAKDDHLEHHGIQGQHWGVRNGPPYPLNAAKVAQKIFERASQKSKTITRSVEDAADSAGGELHGLEHQLKTVDSIERKINKKVDEKDMSISNAATSIKDALRYTVIAPTDDFVDMYEGFKDSMARQGYVETSCDNYFDKFNKGEVKHKAVQSNFADTDGYEFEVQFHTPESQDAKDKKLPLYEERRSSGVSENRKRELEKQMEDLALNVPDPKGIERIRSYR